MYIDIFNGRLFYSYRGKDVFISRDSWERTKRLVSEEKLCDLYQKCTHKGQRRWMRREMYMRWIKARRRFNLPNLWDMVKSSYEPWRT